MNDITIFTAQVRKAWQWPTHILKTNTLNKIYHVFHQYSLFSHSEVSSKLGKGSGSKIMVGYTILHAITDTPFPL